MSRSGGDKPTELVLSVVAVVIAEYLISRGQWPCITVTTTRLLDLHFSDYQLKLAVLRDILIFLMV